MTTQPPKQWNGLKQPPTHSPSKKDPSSTNDTQKSSAYPLVTLDQRVPLTLGATSDIHTTDLTEPCLRKVLLRHEEKTEPIAQTALFRGLLAGKVLEHLHEWNSLDDSIEFVKSESVNMLVAELAAEGRQISDSVEKNIEAIQGEVIQMAELYAKRFMPLFSKCEVLGTELPCRVTIDGIRFASHLDLMVRDTHNTFGYGENRLLIIDWKWRQDAPTRAYLARNYQFYMYWLSALEGSILTYPAFDGWVKYEENAQLLWFHLPYLAPFKRKTTCKNENGDDVFFAKGDERPINNILRPVNYKIECVKQMREDLTERVKTMRSGFFPKSPDPVRCQVCDAREFCTRGDTPELLENQ